MGAHFSLLFYKCPFSVDIYVNIKYYNTIAEIILAGIKHNAVHIILRKEQTMIIRQEYDMKKIGNNLKKLRLANGYTIEDIREFLCLGSVQAVYKYAYGTSYPPGDTLLALMQLYNADIYDIIGKEEDTMSSSSLFSCIFYMGNFS